MLVVVANATCQGCDQPTPSEDMSPVLACDDPSEYCVGCLDTHIDGCPACRIDDQAHEERPDWDCD